MSSSRVKSACSLHGKGAAIVVNYSPKFLGSREDFLCGLCAALVERNCTPVLVCPELLSDHVGSVFRDIGAEVVAGVNLERDPLGCLPLIRALVRKHYISSAYLRYFCTSEFTSWVLRLGGVRRLIFAAATSGTLTSVAWKRLLLGARARAAMRPVTHFVAISGFVKSRLESLGFRPQTIGVVHNGIDTNRFHPDESAREEFRKHFSIRPEEWVLSTVSYLVPRKNPEILMKACGQLAGLGIPFRLIVAGDGPLKGELQALSHSLGISDRIHWLGFQTCVNRVFQASDIFLLASTGEAFGYVLAEAMACGVPVVASRDGGIVEVVDDEKTGLLAEPLDPGSFVVAIRRLIDDPELRTQMGTRGVDSVRRRFTVQRMVQETIDLWERACDD